jgi:hypothetical protein
MVGRTPWSAADAPVGLLAPCKMLTPSFRLRDEGVHPQRGPQDQGLRPTNPGAAVNPFRAQRAEAAAILDLTNSTTSAVT